MPIHTYGSLLKRALSSRDVLQEYLSVPVKPMNLAEMSHLSSASCKDNIILDMVGQLAARTARCCQYFDEPIIQNQLHRRNADRLRWAMETTVKEFAYCVALHEVAQKYVSSGIAFASHPPTAVSSKPIAYVCSAADNKSANNTDGSPQRLYSQELRYWDAAENQSPLPFPAEASVLTSSFRVAEMSREEMERRLSSGTASLQDVPFTVALEMLRPQQNMLDVMINEVAIQSSDINAWISCFCRHRVAWRVLHEHLLHLTQPSHNSRVVRADEHITPLLSAAGSTVADIYSKLTPAVQGTSLTIHTSEDPSLVLRAPAGHLLTSSTSSPPFYSPSPGMQLRRSNTIYSVEGHLNYIFRELLKNACAAQAEVTDDIHLNVMFCIRDEWVTVDFIDTAGGIAASHAKAIWKFGWTTSPHYEGHLGGFGIGLPTSKVYMDLWGGSIDVYTTKGIGTTVRVRYPTYATEASVPFQ